MLKNEDIEKFIKHKGLASSTSSYYRSILSSLKESLKDRDLDYDFIVDWLEEKYPNPSSRATAARVIKSYAAWKRKTIPPIGEENIMKRFNLERIEDIVIKKKIKSSIIQKELKNEQLTEIFNNLYGVEFSAIWSLAWFGCRPRELVAINSEDVSGKKVTIITEKTKVPRILFGDTFTIKHLKRYIKYKLDYSQIYRICKRFDIYPKMFRSTFITRMQRQLKGMKVVNVPLLVKYMAGHTVADITHVYTEYLEDTKIAMLKYHYLLPFEKRLKRN